MTQSDTLWQMLRTSCEIEHAHSYCSIIEAIIYLFFNKYLLTIYYPFLII